MERPVRVVENIHAFTDSSLEPYPVCISLLTESERKLFALTMDETTALIESLELLMSVQGAR